MAGTDDRPAQPASDERLDNRIVRRISEHAGHVSFNGLRRSLSAHPESLSRALRRLERFGVVLHDAAGYALADGPGADADAGVRPPFHPIGEVDLPPGASRDWVLGQMAGRWFRSLRWVGVVEGSGPPWLIWSVPGTEGHAFLTLEGRRLRVGTDRKDLPGADALESAARDLLASALERLGRHPASGGSGTRSFDLHPVPTFRGPN